MELKLSFTAKLDIYGPGFNRTFMELKYLCRRVGGSNRGGFNRTFMELKSKVKAFFSILAKSFNRTFMELK